MEESRASELISLPPGFRFRPSEEELLGHYLAGKNAEGGAKAAEGFIGEMDMYGCDPFELPENSSYAFGSGGKKRHWYCYYAVSNDKGFSGAKRKTKSGFWLRKGRVKLINGSDGNGVLGKRRMFVFHSGTSAKTAVRTDWTLYEYSLIDHLKASFVLCRVFAKSRPKNGLVYCAEESVSTVRHVGIQHDGDNYSSTNDASNIDDQNVLNFEFPIYIDPDSEMNLDNFTAHHLLSILEEDFLELDDLAD